ncbi:DMT family transporter [Sediminibacterium salmoneum]|uniref:DMT family transporter n=1 Tax=Sediminibacterium salmoneum TaxID=426421 RepID=UPI00047CAA9D|nr:DMT family transporter [Sediminibacterium salmoneum]
MKQALIKLHISVFLAGFTGILGVLIHLNEMTLVWYRIMITVVSLSVLFALTKKSTRIPKKQAIHFFLIGTLIALHWVAFYGSIKLSNVSIGLVCFSATGLFTALLEPLLVTKKLQWAELGLGLLSLLGIYLIFHFDERYQTGIIVGIVSAFLAALFSVLNKKQVADAEPTIMMLYELTGGLVIITVLMPAYAYFFPETSIIPTLSDLGWLLVLSWLCTIVAMQLMLDSLKKVSAFTQNLSLNLEPVYAIIMAFILFDENKYLSSSFYYGVGLIILSVVLQMARMLVKHSAKTKQ